jgi:hypothetical protein
MNNIFNLLDTEVVICIILVPLKRVGKMKRHIDVCLYISGIDLLVSTILLFDFVIIPTVWYFFDNKRRENNHKWNPSYVKPKRPYI